MLTENLTTANDFLKYFKDKAKALGVVYQTVRIKDNSVLKSCVKNHTSTEIKKMIDYIWENEELDIVGKTINYKQYGIYLLSSFYWSKIYNEAMEVKKIGSKKSKENYTRLTY